MPRYALETIAASAVAPGAGGAAMSAVTGNSLRVRDASASWLLDVMQLYQAAGSTRITSPLLHDNVVGLTLRAETGNQQYLQLPWVQPLTPQDTLTLNAAGSAVAGDVELAALQIMYEDLAGVDANLINVSEMRRRAVELFSPRAVITSTGAGWTGDVAITALDDQLKANQEYAWLGVASDGTVPNASAVGMVSPDWGNLRIASPLNPGEHVETAYYLANLSERSAMPTIPVFNASQKSNVVMTLLANENITIANINLFLVRLAPVSTRGRR